MARRYEQIKKQIRQDEQQEKRNEDQEKRTLVASQSYVLGFFCVEAREETDANPAGCAVILLLLFSNKRYKWQGNQSKNRRKI